MKTGLRQELITGHKTYSIIALIRNASTTIICRLCLWGMILSSIFKTYINILPKLLSVLNEEFMVHLQFFDLQYQVPARDRKFPSCEYDKKNRLENDRYTMALLK